MLISGEWRNMVRADWTLKMSGFTDALLAASGDVAGRANGVAVQPPPPGVLAPNLAIREIAVSVRDLGARQQAFQAVAAGSGASAATVGQAIVQSVEAFLVTWNVPHSSSRSAVESWLAQGGTLRVGTNLAAPLPLYEFTSGTPQFRGGSSPSDLLQFVAALNIGASVGP